MEKGKLNTAKKFAYIAAAIIGGVALVYVAMINIDLILSL